MAGNTGIIGSSDQAIVSRKKFKNTNDKVFYLFFSSCSQLGEVFPHLVITRRRRRFDLADVNRTQVLTHLLQVVVKRHKSFL